jgi:hypothetical protein
MKYPSTLVAGFALSVSLLACAAPSCAFAAPSAFFGRDDSSGFGTSFPNSLAKFNEFTALLSSFGVDTIESAAGVNPGLTFGATGITATTQGVVAQNAPGFQIGSQALLELDAAGPGPAVDTVISFSEPITGAGLFVIQGGDGANNNPITFRLENTIATTSKDVVIQVGPGWGADNFFFIGIGDTDPFNKLTLIETGDAADGMLYDNVVAGFFVPEPGPVAMLLCAAACALAALGKRRGLLGRLRGR